MTCGHFSEERYSKKRNYVGKKGRGKLKKYVIECDI